MKTDLEQLEQDIVFGAEVERFLKSKVGRYLLDRSAEEVQLALEKLKAVSPENSLQIRELQDIIKRNEGVEMWLKEVIQSAWDARDIIEGIE